MKRIAYVVIALSLLGAPAFAQQTPNEELEVAAQLLHDRTMQVIKLGVELQRLTKQLQAAQTELAKNKTETDKTKPPAKP